MPYSRALISLAGLALAGCDIEPALVYIPEAPPQVVVQASISANDVIVGEALTLHAARYYRGGWKQVDRKSLPKDSCWVRRPPRTKQEEVADSIQWMAHPEGHAKFNVAYRPDHTRTVVFSAPGRYLIRGVSSVWCGPPQAVVPAELEIIVREQDDD